MEEWLAGALMIPWSVVTHSPRRGPASCLQCPAPLTSCRYNGRSFAVIQCFTLDTRHLQRVKHPALILSKLMFQSSKNGKQDKQDKNKICTKTAALKPLTMTSRMKSFFYLKDPSHCNGLHTYLSSRTG